MRNEEKKILVVDDTQFMVTVISYALKSANYQVVTAFSGQEALEKVKTEKPDLILLDVIMPDMNGYEVCTLLRDDFRYNLIPIIMLTGQTDEEAKLQGLELGADDYIVKPFVNRELLARVKNTLVRLERIRECNPITGLRGNKEIESEITRRIVARIPFAVLYCDLDSFKPYNDIYGFANGDKIIQATADILYDCVEHCGTETDFVGHIGGDDFVVILAPESAIPVARAVTYRFDVDRHLYYKDEDVQRGCITAQDREGVTKQFDLIGISIAIVFSEADQITDTMRLSEVAAVLKKKAKAMNGSSYATSSDVSVDSAVEGG